MSFPSVLQKVTMALNNAGIAYMLTGSFASAYYGSPRSTQDIDLVIAAAAAQSGIFIESLPGNQYWIEQLELTTEWEEARRRADVPELK